MPRYSPRTGLLETYQVGPFDSPHIYAQWGGKLPGGESWACGIRLGKKTGTATAADAAAILGQVGTVIKNMHVSDQTNLGSGAKLSFVKVNTVGTDGKYIDGGGTNQTIFADLPGAGTSAQTFPNQIALAVTWTTGFSRGPAHKGRIYLPLYNAGLDSNGLISAAAQSLAQSNMFNFVTSVNLAAATYEMCVFSRKAGAAGHRRITGVQVGRVLDTQRRRRRSQTEAY